MIYMKIHANTLYMIFMSMNYVYIKYTKYDIQDEYIYIIYTKRLYIYMWQWYTIWKLSEYDSMSTPSVGDRERRAISPKLINCDWKINGQNFIYHNPNPNLIASLRNAWITNAFPILYHRPNLIQLELFMQAPNICRHHREIWIYHIDIMWWSSHFHLYDGIVHSETK